MNIEAYNISEVVAVQGSPCFPTPTRIKDMLGKTLVNLPR
jgi:hypothetical protein